MQAPGRLTKRAATAVRSDALKRANDTTAPLFLARRYSFTPPTPITTTLQMPITLTYFDIRGRAEPIRLLMEDAGVSGAEPAPLVQPAR